MIATTPTLQLVGQLLDGLVETLQDTIEEHEKVAEGGPHRTAAEPSKNSDLRSGSLEEITAETVTIAYSRSTQKIIRKH